MLETGRKVAVAAKHLHLRVDGSYFLDLTVDPRVAPPSEIGQDVVIPRIEEVAEITKRVVETGRVRVHKSVTEDPFTVDEPTIRERYEVERVSVNRVVEAPEAARTEGDTIVIPVYDEEVVTTTRLILREELRLTKKRTVEHNPQTVTLRKETVNVERTPAAPGVREPGSR